MTAMANSATVVPVQVRWNPLLHARVGRLAERLHITRTAAFHVAVSLGMDALESLPTEQLAAAIAAAVDA
jgi:hypothetical protein